MTGIHHLEGKTNFAYLKKQSYFSEMRTLAVKKIDEK